MGFGHRRHKSHNLTNFLSGFTPPCVLGSLSPIHAHTRTVRRRRCALAENEPHTHSICAWGGSCTGTRGGGGAGWGPCHARFGPGDRRFAPFTMCWPRCWRGRWISGRLGVEHFRFVLCHTSGFFITGLGRMRTDPHTEHNLFFSFFFIGRSGLCPTPHLIILIHCC